MSQTIQRQSSRNSSRPQALRRNSSLKNRMAIIEKEHSVRNNMKLAALEGGDSKKQQFKRSSTITEPEPETPYRKQRSAGSPSSAMTVASPSELDKSTRVRRSSLTGFFHRKRTEEQATDNTTESTSRRSLTGLFGKKPVEEKMSAGQKKHYDSMSPSTRFVYDYSRSRGFGESSSNLSLLGATGSAYGTTSLGNLLQSSDGVIIATQGGSASPLKKLLCGQTEPTFLENLTEASPRNTDCNRLVDFNFSLNNMIIQANAISQRSWKRFGMRKSVTQDIAIFSVTVEFPRVEQFDSSMGVYRKATVFGQPNFCRTFDAESKWVCHNISEGRCLIKVWYHQAGNPFEKTELGLGAFDFTAETVGEKQSLSVPVLSNDGKATQVGVVQVDLSDMMMKQKDDEKHFTFDESEEHLFTDLYPIDSVSQIFNRQKYKNRKTHFDRLLPSVVHAHCMIPLTLQNNSAVAATVEEVEVQEQEPETEKNVTQSRSRNFEEAHKKFSQGSATTDKKSSIVQKRAAAFEKSKSLEHCLVKKQVAALEAGSAKMTIISNVSSVNAPASTVACCSPRQKLSWKPQDNASNNNSSKSVVGLPFLGRKFGESEAAPLMPEFTRQFTEESHTLSLSPTSSIPMSAVPEPPALDRLVSGCTELTSFLSMISVC